MKIDVPETGNATLDEEVMSSSTPIIAGNILNLGHPREHKKDNLDIIIMVHVLDKCVSGWDKAVAGPFNLPVHSAMFHANNDVDSS